MAPADRDLVRGTLCGQAIRLSRALTKLVPDEPEVTGLLALLLLTDVRRAARISDTGELVPLGAGWQRGLARRSANHSARSHTLCPLRARSAG